MLSIPISDRNRDTTNRHQSALHPWAPHSYGQYGAHPFASQAENDVQRYCPRSVLPRWSSHFLRRRQHRTSMAYKHIAGAEQGKGTDGREARLLTFKSRSVVSLQSEFDHIIAKKRHAFEVLAQRWRCAESHEARTMCPVAVARSTNVLSDDYGAGEHTGEHCGMASLQ